MALHNQSLSTIVQEAKDHLERVHVAREIAFPLARQTVHLCASAIRAAHRHEYEDSMSLLGKAQNHLRDIRCATENYLGLYYVGYVADAQKEYAEAWATLSFLSGKPLLGPTDLGVEVAPYLNGLAEAASELRRSVLDSLREEEIIRPQEWMNIMDEVYDLLISVDFPGAITGGLRRTIDQLRGVLERTRGDLTMTIRQHSLERKLAMIQDHAKGVHEQQ